MDLETFRSHYGSAFYGFINSELGIAMLQVLKENDPATRVVGLPPESQTANSQLFLGQITGWRDCVAAIQTHLVVPPDGAPRELESTYERDDDGATTTKPEREPVNTVPPPAPVASPKTRRKQNRKS